jgi:hypothetical protein
MSSWVKPLSAPPENPLNSFAVSNGWILQNPSNNGYSDAFGYNMRNGVTITLETTKGPGSTDEPRRSRFFARSSST